VQLRQEGLDRLLLLAVLKPEADSAAFRTEAARVIGETVGAGFSISVACVPAIPAGPGGKVSSIVRCLDPPAR
jgi:hypothetical protein